MLIKKQNLKPLIAFCLTSVLAFSWGLAQQSVAEETPREGLPGRRVGGGTRGGCTLGGNSLIALVPETNLALTTTAYPTLFFYVPEMKESKMAEFVLLDENEELVYESSFELAGQPGIVSFSLPNSEGLSPLEVGKNYQWYFSIVCNPNDRAEDIAVDGWLQRVNSEPDLAFRLQNATLFDQASLYISENLWADALVTLAEARWQRPNDVMVAQEWKKLLQLIGLDTIAREPLLNYPQPVSRNESTVSRHPKNAS